MTRAWEIFINMPGKSEFENEFAALLSDIMSEGIAKIDSLTDEEIERAIDSE